MRQSKFSFSCMWTIKLFDLIWSEALARYWFSVWNKPLVNARGILFLNYSINVAFFCCLPKIDNSKWNSLVFETKTRSKQGQQSRSIFLCPKSSELRSCVEVKWPSWAPVPNKPSVSADAKPIGLSIYLSVCLFLWTELNRVQRHEKRIVMYISMYLFVHLFICLSVCL